MRNAALLWVLVGLMLCVRGFIWVLGDAHTHRLLAIILPAAVLLGILKGLAMLRKSATDVVARIHVLDEHTPFWHVFSRATYVLIAGMILLGLACRWAGAHWNIAGIVGCLYLIVGCALITGSGTYWRASAMPTPV